MAIAIKTDHSQSSGDVRNCVGCKGESVGQPTNKLDSDKTDSRNPAESLGGFFGAAVSMVFLGGGRGDIMNGFRGGRGGWRGMRGGRGRGGRGRGGGSTVKKDPCSVYISFVHPIEATCAAQLLDVAQSASNIKFGRHCYLTFGSEDEASSVLGRASDMEFGGQKPYVDNAFMSQTAKEAGKRGPDMSAQVSPSKKIKDEEFVSENQHMRSSFY